MRRVPAVKNGDGSVRSKGVNEALAERMPVATGTDTETFAALYERTFPRVYAYVASLLRDRSAAEDVTAQAFERAYRKRARLPRAARQQGGLAVRDRPQRRARRAAPAQAPRRPRGEPEDTAAGAPTTTPSWRCGARSCAPRSRLEPAARPARAQVLGRPLQRRDRARARPLRDRRRHPPAPHPDQAAKRPASLQGPVGPKAVSEQ